MSDPTAVTQATYARVAAAYARVSAAGFVDLRAQADAFARRVGTAAVVLDVGCGPARDTRALRECGLRTYGLDLSAAMLRADGVPDLVRADMRALPVRTDAVDGVWCQAALLHVPRPAVPTVLAEFARVLVGGGALRLVVAEGAGEGYEEAVQYGGGRRWFVRHRLPELQQQLERAGFVVLRVARRAGHRDWLAVEADLAG